MSKIRKKAPKTAKKHPKMRVKRGKNGYIDYEKPQKNAGKTAKNQRKIAVFGRVLCKK